MAATFDFVQPNSTGISGQDHLAGSEAFSGHMEMYYFTTYDEPVTIMQTNLDISEARHYC